MMRNRVVQMCIMQAGHGLKNRTVHPLPSLQSHRTATDHRLICANYPIRSPLGRSIHASARLAADDGESNRTPDSESQQTSAKTVGSKKKKRRPDKSGRQLMSSVLDISAKSGDNPVESEKQTVKTSTMRQVKKKRETKQFKSNLIISEDILLGVSQEIHPKKEEAAQRENVQMDLLKQILTIDEDTSKAKNQHEDSVDDLFSSANLSPADHGTEITLDQRNMPSRRDEMNRRFRMRSRDGYRGDNQRLNLFHDNTQQASLQPIRSEDESTWTAVDWYDKLYNDNVVNLVDKPFPTNAFEEHVTLTEEGKMWRFPVDNEEGMEEEAEVPFYEHVFLESRLRGWCPPRGAIRDFMVSVTTALSSNPHLTVAEKHQHIDWFRDYFAEKSKLLHQLGLKEG